MSIRNEDADAIKSKTEKAHIKKLQHIFALKKTRPKKYANAAERDAAMKEELMRRAELARKGVSGNEP